MSKTLKIVIFPGLDGTGQWLTDFSALLARHHPVEVITYPPHDPLNYDALLAYVEERLPSEDYVLIGESFSGPLAIRVAWTNPPNLKAVVLSASFARLDLPFKRLRSIMATYLPATVLPAILMNIVVMNGRATATQQQLLKHTLLRLKQDVIALRIQEALGVDLTRCGKVMHQPALYLRATADRLVPRSAPQIITGIASKLIIRDIPGPHLLFQAEAEQCVDAILDFIASL